MASLGGGSPCATTCCAMTSASDAPSWLTKIASSFVCSAERRDVARVRGLRADVDHAHVPELRARRQRGAQSAEDGRERVDRGDPLAIEPCGEAADAVAAQVVRAHRGAVQQSCVDGHVGRREAHRPEERQPVGLAERQPAHEGVGEEHDAALGLRHALGRTGGPRRVEDVRERVRRDLGQRERRIGPFVAVDLDDRAGRARERTGSRRECPIRQEDGRGAIAQDEAQAFVGIAAIERHVGPAAAQRRDHRLDGRRLARAQQRREAGTAGSRRLDARGDRARRRLERRVVDRAAVLDERRLVRQPPRDVLEPRTEGARL